jgi:DNA-binding NarL/FixJ family response regulator
LSSGRISPHTVRVHVRNMAMKIDVEAFLVLAPRQLVYMFVKSQEWEQ